MLIIWNSVEKKLVATLPDSVRGIVLENDMYPDMEVWTASLVKEPETLPEDAVLLQAGNGLEAYAARRRWEIETGGIEFGGQTVATDRISQGLVDRAVALVAANPGQQTRFKTSGGFVTLADEQIVALGKAVGEHVRTMFNREASALDHIADGSFTTREQVEDKLVNG